MVSNVLPKKHLETTTTWTVTGLDFPRAKRQLSLILLNRTAALPAALSNLTRPRAVRYCDISNGGGQWSEASRLSDIKVSIHEI